MTEQEYLDSKNIVTEYVDGFTDRNGWENTSLTTLLKDFKEQLILSGVSDIVHRAELKVLENVSDYIPCEIYSQAIIFSQKKRDNVR